MGFRKFQEKGSIMNQKSILTLSAAFLAAFALSADFPLAENGKTQ